MARGKRRDAGTGGVYQRKTDGYWVGSVELGWENRKRRRKIVVGKTKADAVEKLKAVRKQLDATGTISTNIPTLEKWLDTWLDDIAANRNRPKTITANRSLITEHITPHLGHHKLDKLQPAHILAWHKTLRAKKAARGGGTLAESTVLRIHAVLSRALDDARRIYGLPGNPAKLVDRPGKGKAEVDFLDGEQAAIVLERVIDDPLGSRWAFALLTGQRQGECLGLRWSHVDLDNGVADIAWQLQRLGYRHGCTDDNGEPCGRRFAGNCPDRVLDVTKPDFEYTELNGALCLTRPKAAVHIIPLVPSLVHKLKERKERVTPGVHDLVWTRDGHRPIDLRADYDAWITLLDACGLPRVRLHSARHTCATTLLSLGVRENLIMQLVGHSTVAAARAYQHADVRAARAAAIKLGRALGVEPAELTTIE